MSELTKVQFVSDLADAIEQAVAQAQGMMDWKRQKTPDEIAKDVASWLPESVWSEP
jgi:hypothetical protein